MPWKYSPQLQLQMYVLLLISSYCNYLITGVAYSTLLIGSFNITQIFIIIPQKYVLKGILTTYFIFSIRSNRSSIDSSPLMISLWPLRKE